MANITAEVHLSYDYDMSRVNFNDNFEELESAHWQGNTKYWYYTNHGQIEKPEIRDLFKIHGNNKKQNLYKMLEWSGNYYEDITRNEAIEEVYNCFGSISEFRDAADDCDVKIKELFTITVTRGYSQGDYAEVVQLDNQYQLSQKDINNYFWDNPVYLRVDLDLNNTQVEIYGWDMDIPEYWNYPYDIDDAKEVVKTYLEKEYKHVAAKDKIIKVVIDAFPNEVKTPRF